MMKWFKIYIFVQIGWLAVVNWDTIDTLVWLIFYDGTFGTPLHLIQHSIESIFWKPEPYPCPDMIGIECPETRSLTIKLLLNYLPTLMYSIYFVTGKLRRKN